MSNVSRTVPLGAVFALVLGFGLMACGGDSASSDGAQSTSASAEEHTHADGTSHAHAAMDTVARDVALEANGSDLGGHVTVLRGADTLRVLVEVQEASPETRYDARLLSGDCGSSGDRLASLTPVLTGSSGSGSSQASVAGSAVSGHAHGAVIVEASGGDATACAPVHLGGEHSHGG